MSKRDEHIELRWQQPGERPCQCSACRERYRDGDSAMVEAYDQHRAFLKEHPDYKGPRIADGALP